MTKRACGKEGKVVWVVRLSVDDCKEPAALLY